jgi:ABC-2 type transport system ATP-binding protein
MDNLSVVSNLVYTYHNLEYEKNITLETIIEAYKSLFPLFDFEFSMKLITYFELNKKMKYDQLSQGMSSIFNFICGLSCRTKLTMFDEPVLGMDVTVRKAAYEVLLHDYTEYPRTFIISSHVLSEIEGLLSDIILIDSGKLIFNESLDNIRQSAYRADAAKDILDLFCKNKKVLFRKNSDICNYAVIYESLTGDDSDYAKVSGIKISPVRPEDLCIYLTKSYKEDELLCLWTKQN